MDPTAPPAVMARPAWSGEAARDRLSSTTFLTALAHGIVILGVTFSATSSGPGEVINSMDVVLVTHDSSAREAPANAVLLAQRNLQGAGNAGPDASARTAPGLPMPRVAAAPVRSGGRQDHRSGSTPQEAARPVLLARESERKVSDPGERQTARPQAGSLPVVAQPTDVLARSADATVLPDKAPDELLTSASTREARIATYLTHWKRRVEQVGTLNFPFAARRAASTANPVLEVAIRADGTLREVIVRTSSGERRLDSAAMEILRLAAPFEPFPDDLSAEYKVLRFAYEWRFSGGGAGARPSATAAAL